MPKHGNKHSEDLIPKIEAVIVEGFKAHRGRVKLPIAPLTVLSGANSSGKSSVMQALLLLKQTADSPTDRGPLRLDGPHVEFEAFRDFVWHGKGTKVARSSQVVIGVEVDGIQAVSTFAGSTRKPFELLSTHLEMPVETREEGSGHLSVDIGPGTLTVGDLLSDEERRVATSKKHAGLLSKTVRSYRSRGLLLPRASLLPIFLLSPRTSRLSLPDDLWSHWSDLAAARVNARVERIWTALANVLHLPGHRGNPQRNYPYTLVTSTQAPAPFSEVFAGVLLGWQEDGEDGKRKLNNVGSILRDMGLGWKVQADRETASYVRLMISRTTVATRGGARDVVPLPDVGFGVSQVLPVVVALVHAVPNQLVYIEQPEIHLHPRAQKALAWAIVEAARRGVRLVVETHSETMLLVFQTAVALGANGESTDGGRPGINHEDVVFHWFSRDEATGMTRVKTVYPDHAGRYGDLPIDFGETLMDSQREYLRAARDADRRLQQMVADR